MRALRQAWVVLGKELQDALRDRRTLVVVFLSSVLMGPLLLAMLSALVSTLEQKAEQRELLVVGMAHSPQLHNYLLRQIWQVRPAPEGYEQQLRQGHLTDPVLGVPENFDADLQRGESPVLELVSDSGNEASQAGAARVAAMLAGFRSERLMLDLALRGVSPGLLEPFRVQARDLAGLQSRAAQLTGMVGFFVLLAVLSGALNAALDSTAGERERGSLEPLLMNPVSAAMLVLGKWAAVAAVSMAVAVSSCVSFLPAQWLLHSETLQALFHFGWVEVGLFLLILLPFAAAVSAVLMAVAIRCKSFKEAQANSTVVMMGLSLAPAVALVGQSGEQPWYLWLPALAQNTLMLRVLKGEPLDAAHLLIPLLVCFLLTGASLWAVARQLRDASVS